MQRLKELVMYRYGAKALDDDNEVPMFSLNGILDSEKRYFPMTFMRPKMKKCLMKFKVSYAFDRNYKLDNYEIEQRQKTDAEMEMDLRLEKYRHREYQEKQRMSNAEIEDLERRIQIGKEKKLRAKLLKKKEAEKKFI